MYEEASAKAWWDEAKKAGDEPSAKKEAELTACFGGTVEWCRKRLNRRHDLDLFHSRLAFGPDFAGFGARDASERLGAMQRSRFNIVWASISTAASLIAHHKPMPMLLTQEGDFEAMRKGRNYTRALVGLFNTLQIHRITPRTFIDANTCTFGCLHGYLDDNGRPAVERVNPPELFFDPTEAYDGAPRSIYRRRPYSKAVLKARYPEKKALIDEAPAPNTDDKRYFGLDNDMCSSMAMLEEGWHLPSAEGEGDGRRIITCGGAVLLSEEWEYDRFPFVFYRFEERPSGFFGKGIAEHAVDSQIRVNELIRKNSRLQDLGSNTWVYVDGNAEVKPVQMTNAPMQVVRVTGREPKIVTHQATPQDTQVEIDRIQAQLLFALGLSESAASGERAPGVYSGIGLRATDDIQVRRLTPHIKRWEDYHLDIARMLEWLCDQASRANPKFAVDTEDRRGGGRWTKSIVWKDVRMSKGKRAKLQIFPISSLPTTPQGKWAAVTDWIQQGYISQPFALQILDFPDVDAATRRALADLEYAEWQVERVIDGDYDVAITDFQDLDLAAEIFRVSRLMLEMQGAPREILETLERLAEDVADAQGALIPEPAPAAPGMPGMPGDPAAMMDPAAAQAAAAGVAPGAMAPPGAGFG